MQRLVTCLGVTVVSTWALLPFDFSLGGGLRVETLGWGRILTLTCTCTHVVQSLVLAGNSELHDWGWLCTHVTHTDLLLPGP